MCCGLAPAGDRVHKNPLHPPFGQLLPAPGEKRLTAPGIHISGTQPYQHQDISTEADADADADASMAGREIFPLAPLAGRGLG